MPTLLTSSANNSEMSIPKKIISWLLGAITTVFGFFLKIGAFLSLRTLIPAFLTKAVMSLLPASVIAFATSNLAVMATAVIAALLIPSSIIFTLAALNFMLQPIPMLAVFISNMFVARTAAVISTLIAGVSYKTGNTISKDEVDNFSIGAENGAQFSDLLSKVPENVVWGFNSLKNKLSKNKGNSSPVELTESRPPNDDLARHNREPISEQESQVPHVVRPSSRASNQFV